MTLVFALALFAQTLIEPPIQVYTLADPVRPGGLGLAMPDGSYAISVGDNCGDTIQPGMNATFWQVSGFQGIGVIVPLADDGSNETPCNVRLEQLVDHTPCFTNVDGVCDVNAENEAE